MSAGAVVALVLAGLAVAVFGGVALWHAAQLAALRSWLRNPELGALPHGSGGWELALADLYRLLKAREQERGDLVSTLQRYRAAAQALPDGVALLDAGNHIEWANLAVARHFGLDTQRDFGKPITHFLRHPEFLAYLERGAFGEPLLLRAAAGDAVVSVRLIAFGQALKLLHSRDVTAQERLDTMRRDFVANVSHELKTPVTVLSGFVETLGDATLELAPERRQRFVGLMAEQAKRMQRLIEDLLTLSSLESGDAPADEEQIDMRSFVEHMADEARALAPGRQRIEVEVESAARILGSTKELHSALFNLVSNAVRYTPAGGLVRLAWRADARGGVFSVIDTGIGVAPEHIPRLTERFYRVDRGRSRGSGGTGLGLAIAKHALTRHQARLRIDSEPGRGSTFSAVFPAARILPPAPALQSRDSGGALSDKPA